MNSSPSRTTTPQEVPYDNTDAAVHYSGQWGTVTITDVPSSTSSAPIHNTTVTGSSASLNFTGEAVAVYGFRDWGSWKYTVVSALPHTNTIHCLIYWSAPRLWMGGGTTITGAHYGSFPTRSCSSARDWNRRQHTISQSPMMVLRHTTNFI